MLAEYTSDTVVPVPPADAISYLTSDQLGSPRVVTRSDGSIKARHDYLPFGEDIGSTIASRSTVTGYASQDSLRQKFTSKERDAESGLDYFLARYYSSAQGRFISPDEFIGGPDELFEFADDASDNPTFYADLDNPLSLNKYQYCYNNPLSYLDADGHQTRSHSRGVPGPAPLVPPLTRQQAQHVADVLSEMGHYAKEDAKAVGSAIIEGFKHEDGEDVTGRAIAESFYPRLTEVTPATPVR